MNDWQQRLRTLKGLSDSDKAALERKLLHMGDERAALFFRGQDEEVVSRLIGLRAVLPIIGPERLQRKGTSDWEKQLQHLKFMAQKDKLYVEGKVFAIGDSIATRCLEEGNTEKEAAHCLAKLLPGARRDYYLEDYGNSFLYSDHLREAAGITTPLGQLGLYASGAWSIWFLASRFAKARAVMNAAHAKSSEERTKYLDIAWVPEKDVRNVSVARKSARVFRMKGLAGLAVPCLWVWYQREKHCRRGDLYE